MADRLTDILERFDLRARVFHSGAMCGVAAFDDSSSSGHLHLLRSGRLRVEQAHAEVLELDQPTLLFYATSSPHRLVTSPDEEVELLCASVDFGAGAHNPLLASLPPLLAIPLQRKSILSKTLDLLFEEAFSDYCGKQIALDRLTELLMLQMLRFVMEEKLIASGTLAGLADPRLAKALIAIHKQPEASWTLERLAAQSGMSRARFAAHFHQVVGTTPGDYLSDWRLAIAKSLLKQGKPVKNVALDVGYANASALARAFATRLGVSPTTWLAAEKAVVSA